VSAAEVRVALPAHLRTLARVTDEVRVEVVEPVTQRRVLEALERTYPALRGTVRDPITARRRAFVRFYVGEADLSHEPPDAPLPAGVADGTLTFNVIGAMAGG
jgi:sulfur-carrier protein